ncbi:hypothetical protein KZX50_16780 [Bacillus infantis]|uniref:hypothetical protein n=1 Tax=Bacillus infantis TaxID=324767 RepID=UPI0020033C6A|nr:hypothetical protein [Bacillus infantis]MCK6207099.1 hypothetical protein [Bacillus infantis]
MKNKRFLFPLFLSLALILSACTNMDKEARTKDIDQPDKVAEKRVTEETAQVKESLETLKKEEFNWQGEWVFLSDDNLGKLKIDRQDGKTIQYQLSGSVINPNNNESYFNVMEGSGTIEGDKITYTNNLSEDCGGVMIRSGEKLTLTAANESCHTPQVYLDGEYLKRDSISEPPLLSIKDGQFVVRGLTFGDAPSQAKSLHGNPAYEGPDEDGFYEWIQKYEDQELFISYFNKQLDSLNSDAPATVFKEEAASIPGERYKAEDGTYYIYLPETEQLLIYTESSEGEGTISFFITHADGNFHAGVENGWIVPAE